MAQPLYSRDLLRWAACLYRWPLEIDAAPKLSQKAQPCGSSITLSLQTDSEGLVSALGMDCQSCAFGQASAAIMAHHLSGKPVSDAAHMASLLSLLLSGEEPDNDIAGKYPEFALLAAAAPHSARHPAIMLPYKAVQLLLDTQTES
jgi:NifU-like protein involved in Fe-S cluster formation